MLIQKLQYDTVCVGGGISGVFAAVSSARMGARTLLLERSGFLGGSASLGLPLRGIPAERTALLQEFLSLLAKLDGTGSSIEDSVIAVNGETVKLALSHLCRENHVDVLLYTEAREVQIRNHRVQGLTAFGKNANLQIQAPILVDASGTGDLLRNAGALLRDQPLRAYASAVLTGLDPAQLCRSWKQAFVQDGFVQSKPGTQYYGPLLNGWPVCTITICVEPKRCLVQFPITNTVDPANPRSRTRAIADVHLQVYELLKRLSKEPSFESVRISSIPSWLFLYGAPSAKRASGRASSAASFPSEETVATAITETGQELSFQITDLLLQQPDGLLICGALAEYGLCPDTGNAGAAFSTGEAVGICGALAALNCCQPSEIHASAIRNAAWL